MQWHAFLSFIKQYLTFLPNFDQVLTKYEDNRADKLRKVFFLASCLGFLSYSWSVIGFQQSSDFSILTSNVRMVKTFYGLRYNKKKPGSILLIFIDISIWNPITSSFYYLLWLMTLMMLYTHKVTKFHFLAQVDHVYKF